MTVVAVVVKRHIALYPWRTIIVTLFMILLLSGSMFCDCMANNDNDIDIDDNESSCSVEENGGNGSCTVSSAPPTTNEQQQDQEQQEVPTSAPYSYLDCHDIEPLKFCKPWSERGECESNPEYMDEYCRKSCGLCKNDTAWDDGPSCLDNHKGCDRWASRGECTINPTYMEAHCRKSCMLCTEKVYTSAELVQGLDIGVAQKWTTSRDPKEETNVKQHIIKSREYRQSANHNDSIVVPPLKKKCRNENELCTVWALDGECESNPGYMKRECAPACFSCHHLTVEGRCPIDPNAPQAWSPGVGLNEMFIKLTTDPYYVSNHDVRILSSPSGESNDINNNKDDDGGGPWVITMENVVSEEEANLLIALGGEGEGYQRSGDVGELKWDGTHDKDINDGRTSHNSWCSEESKCYQNEVTRRVLARLTNITGIPEVNSEALQLLRYEPGQFYKTHHDYIEHHINRQCGVRILTLYLYLNDVEAGGGTNFDQLNITVMPKRGRALLWPSVLNDVPNEIDNRTTHQALPVEAGIKYGANAWFHMRDYKTPYSKNCA